MRTTIILVATFLGLNCGVVAGDEVSAIGRLFQEDDRATNSVPNYVLAPKPTPTLLIVPEDVVQDSIKQFAGRPNNYHVRWIYTWAGAQKFLAFLEANEGEMIRYQFGSFETEPTEFTFRPTQLSKSFAQFKDNWLKNRGSGHNCTNEKDANTITAALKGR
jgi:hypothetical protein